MLGHRVRVLGFDFLRPVLSQSERKIDRSGLLSENQPGKSSHIPRHHSNNTSRNEAGMPRANLGAGRESWRSGGPVGINCHLPRPSAEVSERLLSGRAGTDQIILMPVPNVQLAQHHLSPACSKHSTGSSRSNNSEAGSKRSSGSKRSTPRGGSKFKV